MKELQDNADHKVEIVEEQQQRKEVKLIGQQRKVRGHILWEYNEKSGELNPATYKKQNIEINSLSVSELAVEHSKVVVNEDCIYFQALNRSNAEKWLKKIRRITNPLTQ